MRKVVLIFISLLLLTGVVVGGCGQPAAPPEQEAPPEQATPAEEVAPPEETTPPEPEVLPPEEEQKALSLSSPAFEEGGEVPDKYSCDGKNISPPLSWSGVPVGTGSFVLIMDDPDAPGGVFTHWVLFNLPPDILELAEDIPNKSELESGALQGKNGMGRTGYFGPCPPGGTHHYRFTLYALDKPIDLAAGVSKERVLETMEGHILAEAQLMGTYRR
jgi:Raf kinase inhibitor-like YbhB/YbcL family protein